MIPLIVDFNAKFTTHSRIGEYDIRMFLLCHLKMFTMLVFCCWLCMFCCWLWMVHVLWTTLTVTVTLDVFRACILHAFIIKLKNDCSSYCYRWYNYGREVAITENFVTPCWFTSSELRIASQRLSSKFHLYEDRIYKKKIETRSCLSVWCIQGVTLEERVSLGVYIHSSEMLTHTIAKAQNLTSILKYNYRQNKFFLCGDL